MVGYISVGERTFGVLTKINLMNKGTGAVYVAKEGDEKWKPMNDEATLIRVHVVQNFNPIEAIHESL
ncbi:hypothetical protein HanPI659440_Chr03g0130751 [Helianthus annuus]|nr:hypothetical protein HanHA300_Chr03g0112951 [Helianthus annuus]KAJ0802596.1 hypothetical protein HanPI659440_Chr03g0130751 [Helianthus annuus]